MKKANLILTNSDGSQVILTGEPASEVLAGLIDQPVTVWAGVSIRNSFQSQVSVCGLLEGSVKTGKFRVFLNEGTYSYFTPEDIVSVSMKQKFQDGSLAVIEVELPKE